MKKARPRLALTMLVRNEARFLAANLLYHRALGVERAYIFLDRCSDDSERIAGSFPWVVPIRVDPADGERIEYVTALQRACMDHALELARCEGIDWLLMLDADEFAFGETDGGPPGEADCPMQRGDLTRLLAGVNDGTEMIRLRPREVVPVELERGAPFWAQRYVHDSERGGNDLGREILDPRNGEVVKWWGLLGHPEGKSIVRASARVQAYGSHSWVRYQGRSNCVCPEFKPLNTEERGFHYHFLVTGPRHWREKFRKLAHEPETWPDGEAVVFPKQCWKEAASVMSEQDSRRYYSRWVALPGERVRELLCERVITEERTVEQVLKRSGSMADNQLCAPKTTISREIRRWSLPCDFWQDATTDRRSAAEL